MNRRHFLKSGAEAGLVLGTSWPSFCRGFTGSGRGSASAMKEARYYRKLSGGDIECLLCPRRCRLGNRRHGYCGVRENRDGTYVSSVYGKICSLNVDPIEKKPFFHFLPGKDALSLATVGCNLKCRFCQNWRISQARPDQVESSDISPAEATSLAVRRRCPAIAFTYTEPIVFIEYVIDTAMKAREEGVRSLVVSNGTILRDPLNDLLEAVDGVKIDLKGFSRSFYEQYVQGDLGTVLETIRIASKSKAWLEIVYLVIPTLNDSPGEIRNMCRWLKNETGTDVPLHFTRFQPMHLLKNLPPTPVETLETARKIALEEGLRFVYIGNVPGHEGENTYCPDCRKPLIIRTGYEIGKFDIRSGKCIHCGASIPGVFD